MVEPTSGESQTSKKTRPLVALAALVTAWSRPAQTTRRTNNVSLPIAFAVHCIAAIAFILSVTLINALTMYRYEVRSWLSLWMDSVDSLIMETIRYPFQAAMVIVGCEVGILCPAVLLAAWGARDEPLVDSFRHALRRTWLHCGHVVIVTLLAGGAAVAIEHAKSRHGGKILVATEHLVFPTYPANPTKPQIAKYNELVREYRAEYQSIEKQYPSPFLVRYSDQITSFAFMAGAIWILAALMRGVAADRPHRRQPGQLLCRECGYNLIATDPDSRCPECGKPVRLTLDPPLDQAPPWQRAKGLSHLPGAYMATLWRATRSKQMAYGLGCDSASDRHHSYLAVNLLLTAIASFLILSFIFAPEYRGWLDLFWIVASWLAVVWASIMLGLLLFCVLIVGIAIRVRTGRNQLAGVNQLACYLGGYLVACTLILGVAIAAAVRWYDLYKALCRDAGISADALIYTGFGMLVLVLFARFLIKLWWASAGVRYLTPPPTNALHMLDDTPDNMPRCGA